MYGLPKDFSATVFVGHELDEIGFAINTIALVFDGEISITLWSSFSYSSGPEKVSHNDVIPVASSSLMDLIGKTVISGTAQPEGTLTLVFQDGNFFQCLDDMAPYYESYSIQLGDRRIIV